MKNEHKIDTDSAAAGTAAYAAASDGTTVLTMIKLKTAA